MVKPNAQLYSNQELEAEVDGNTKVLAFDISKKCVGWALGVDGELVNYGKFVFKTTTDLGERILSFWEFLEALVAAYSPDIIVLEEPLRRAKVRVHFEFLGVLRLLHMMHYGENIPDNRLISPTMVKKHLHVKRGKGHDENKRIMVDKINQMFSLSLNYHKHSAIEGDDDVADAIAVLVTWWRINGKHEKTDE